MEKSDSIRVFISSTFVGLEKERDHLMRMIFPKIKYEALKRNVAFVPIDLRWGVTKEQAEQGKIPWICLNEINNSRPFFIGILGKRYGWQPPIETLNKDTQLEKCYPFLRKDVEKGYSMTEIEIQYAVLRNSDRMDAFFYISMDKDIEDAQKLLVDKIISDNRYPLKYFNSPEQLGELIEKDLFNLINTRFPISNISESHRIKKGQEIVIDHLTSFFIPRDVLLSKIDCFVENKQEHTLLLYGLSGCGKSSLLARWIHKANHPVFYFFAGGFFSEKSIETVQKYLIAELKSYLMVSEEESNSDYYNQLVKLFDLLCEKKERVIIIIDGVDQIVESNMEQNALLSWLPVSRYPIKMIVSTNQAMQKDQMEYRGASVLEIPSLTQGERKQLIELYLHSYSKSLTNNQIELIANNSKSSNAITLSYMLNEMVYDSVYETVDKYISQYINEASNSIFLKQMLHRANEKYEGDIVKRTMGVLYASYSGLGIDEIIKILDITHLNWSFFYCSYSFLFSEHNGLLSISNDIKDIVCEEYGDKESESQYGEILISYYEAIMESKGPLYNHPLTKEQIRALLSCELMVERPSQEDIEFYINSYCLSNYMFEGKERCFVELSYQYWKKGDVNRLYNLLLDPSCFVYLMKTNDSALIKYWRFIHKNDTEKTIKDYSIISNPDNYTSTFLCDYYSHLADLTESFPEITDSDYTVLFLNKSIQYIESTSSYAKRMFLIPLYNKLGIVYSDRHDISRAIDCFEKAIQYAEADDDYSFWAKNKILLNYAQRMADALQFDSCIEVCVSAIEKMKSSSASSVVKKQYLSDVYEILGNAYAGKSNTSSRTQDTNDYLKLSIKYLVKSLEVRRECLNIDPKTHLQHYVQTLINLSMSFYEIGNYQAFIDGFNEAEKLLVKNGIDDFESKNTLTKLQMNYGSIMTVIAENTSNDEYYSHAWKKLKSAFEIIQELYDADDFKYSVLYGDIQYSIGRLFRKIGHPDKSIKYYENAIKLYEQDREKKAMSFVGLGLSYSEMNDSNNKKDMFHKAIQIYKSLYTETSFLSYKEKIEWLQIEMNK